MKKILFLALVMLFFAGGCVNFKLRDAAAGNKNEDITLRIAWWGEQPRHDYTLEVIELFEKKYPYIHIEPEYANWDDYWKKLAPLAAANQLPDIVQMDLLYLAPYSDILEDLSPYINQEMIKTEAIDKRILSGGKIGQHVFGFPLGLNAPAVIVDRELLLSNGINFPDKSWTWDEFEKVAVQIHKDKRIFGTNGMKSIDVFFSYYLRTKGENLFNKNGTGLGYEDDQLFIDYFEMQLRLLDQGAFPRPDVTEQIQRIEDELLINQQSSMSWAHSNQYIGFWQAANRPLELIPPPGPGQEKGLTVKPSMLFSISQSSKSKEAAALFINFFINDVKANKLIKGERGVPLSSEVANKIEKVLTAEQKKVFDYINSIKDSTAIVEKADPLGSIEVVRILQDVSNQILFKKITPQEGAQLFRTEANNILSKENIE
ncbi:ABC transporter substrate-binding protein [Bacillus sp. OK048]|uniref:ABC transporter substrate-binding protein n=1 Tax=Bacillus sp. OK048 TaxID=1882761 RepID=UPI00087F0761|nr:ABC transporter substrate-binding protein [Bacillus sp. OK048]SDM43376.1 carbohydrate ABC transporter substrate-binding protein, CUT1 family [Bacillus sp. OK048]